MGRLTRTAAPPLLAAAVLLAGCGGEPAPGTIDTMGTNGQVGEILLRNVYFEAPRGGVYEPGDVATLRLRIVNDADHDDHLVGVRSAADEARIRWDRDCDGSFDTVASLPVEAEGQAPHSPAYYIELVGLDRIVRAGTTVPVTFEFRHSGAGTVDAMVEARRDGSRGAPLSCSQTTATSPTPVDDITVGGVTTAGAEPAR